MLLVSWGEEIQMSLFKENSHALYIREHSNLLGPLVEGNALGD